MVTIRINSNDMYGEAMFEKHSCIKKILKNGILYENANMKVYILYNKVLIKHFSSERQSTLILQEGKYKQFIYKTKYLFEKFNVITKFLDIQKKVVNIKYDLYLQGDLINKIKLEIREG